MGRAFEDRENKQSSALIQFIHKTADNKRYIKYITKMVHSFVLVYVSILLSIKDQSD